ncbi:MAG TPA: four helix bundle protein [Anaeromyxobacteraceae bacterium]|nr:four helix bundle protein [Anaeromyxobacteraceae bacterium]
MTENTFTSFTFQRLDVYVAARELAALVHLARLSDPELRDQASRASKSVVLNLAEGLGSESPGVKRRHFAIAAGSVQEVAAAVDLAVAIRALAPEVGERAMALALRVRRMLRGLMR